MTTITIKIVIFLAIFLVVSLMVAPSFAQGNAQGAIESAKRSIKESYDAITAAESAGANIDSLMGTLNDAANLLSKAELSYASGDYGSAYNYATQSQNKLGGLVSSANALTATAQANNQQNMLYTVLLAIFSAVVLCSGIFSWVVLGKRKRRNIYGSTSV